MSTARRARTAPAQPAAGPAEPGRSADAAPPVPANDPAREDARPARNEVVLVGRVSAPAEERTLPSGDVLATWRLVVDRPAMPRRAVREGVRPVTVDTLDCVAWAGRTRRSARALRAGDVVRVEGALRRRFWRAGAGAASRTEVEVAVVERLSRVAVPPRRTPAPPASEQPVPDAPALAAG